jgi:hypothetical protein
VSEKRPRYDPYAPPSDGLPPPPLPVAPLPDGIQRYGIDVDVYRARTGQALRARIARGVVIGIGYFVFLVRGASFPLASLYFAVPIWGIVIGASYVLAQARVRRLEPSVLQGYELLVSRRVLRRTAYGAPPAEILGPEVTSIVEIPEGLSIASTHPKQMLLVTHSLAGFAEVRDHLRSWAPIETRRGVRAYARRLSHSFGRGFLSGFGSAERTRHRLDGALALDPTLLGELTAVRTLAMPFDPKSVRARRSLRILIILWVLVILLLAIWQLRSIAHPASGPVREQHWPPWSL